MRETCNKLFDLDEYIEQEMVFYRDTVKELGYYRKIRVRYIQDDCGTEFDKVKSQLSRLSLRSHIEHRDRSRDLGSDPASCLEGI